MVSAVHGVSSTINQDRFEKHDATLKVVLALGR